VALLTEELWKMKKRVDYDVRYLENWSLLLDLRCIWRTIFNIGKGEEVAN
jgi:lipopolysaccharide/colanic/teichoic acid biosynthesis glycosyltransferase